NTDQGTTAMWSSGPFRVVAVDGHNVNAPTDISDRSVLVPAGGRMDVEVQAPADGSATRVRLGGRSMVIAPPGGSASTPRDVAQPRGAVDLLNYGTPAPTGIDTTNVHRAFDYVIGRQPPRVRSKPLSLNVIRKTSTRHGWRGTAVAVAVAVPAAIVLLLVYYTVGGPFGTLNDLANALIGALSAVLAAQTAARFHVP